MEISIAPGAPGTPARWSSAIKEGVGTAAFPGSPLWFTLADGIVNEVCYPRIDLANISEMGFIVTDGQNFFSEERRHTLHEQHTPREGIPAYEIINLCSEGHYRITKRICSDPRRPVLLQEVLFEPLRGNLADYHLYLLITPHIQNTGMQNTGWTGDYKGYPMLFAEREGVVLAAASSTPFLRLSCGYAGVSDPWRDLSSHKQLTTCYKRAEGGSVILAAEIDLKSSKGRFLTALAFGAKDCEAGYRARVSLLDGMERSWSAYLQGWDCFHQRLSLPENNYDSEEKKFFCFSRALLQIHASPELIGSTIASLSLPWASSCEEYGSSGYQSIYPADQVHVAMALLAAGDAAAARDALLFLMSIQERDGHWVQSLGQRGSTLSTDLQMDGTALPILLADQLRRRGLLNDIQPLTMVQKAASFLIQQGPTTQKDRWREQSGYTPFTIAAEIAALLAAADFIAEEGEFAVAEYLREIADWWNESIERWLYVTDTTLARLCHVPGYYVRMTPFDHVEDGPPLNPEVILTNMAPPDNRRDYRDLISVDALALVRMGLRLPTSPQILHTVAAIDATLRAVTTLGALWHRCSYDGYGEKDDGSPFDGTGIGRVWPLLSGERAHYELACGKVEAARELLTGMRLSADNCLLIPEQVWDSADLPARKLYNGKATGSARPLVAAHAEALILKRSVEDQCIFDMPPQTCQRYIVNKVKPIYGLWRFHHQLTLLPRGLRLRIQTGGAAIVRWSADNWSSYNDLSLRPLPLLGLFYADLPVEELSVGSSVSFTFFWEASQQWEGKNFCFNIEG